MLKIFHSRSRSSLMSQLVLSRSACVSLSVQQLQHLATILPTVFIALLPQRNKDVYGKD